KVTATDGDGSAPSLGAADSANLSVIAGAATKLQVLIPGETAVPGSSTGRNGNTTAQTAGVPFNVTVNSTDDYWNAAVSTHVVKITTTDSNDSSLEAAARALGGGTTVFSVAGGNGVTLVTAATAQITVTDQDAAALLTHTSQVVSVNPGTSAKLLVLLPGE